MGRPIELKISEADVSRIIIEEAMRKLAGSTRVDVVVVGAGPSGLAAAYYLAKGGARTLIVERGLGIGGGIRAGGMLLPVALVEEEAREILEEVGCRLRRVAEGVYAFNPIEAMAKLAVAALDAGADIMLGVTVEDVLYEERDEIPRIRGVVIQWTPVIEAGWHVDPLMIEAKAVLDATGHDAEVVSIAAAKIPEIDVELPGEGPMWAREGEAAVVEKTGKIIDGLYVAGMAVAEVEGLPRMGPLLGGMLLSGKRAAELILRELKSGSRG